MTLIIGAVLETISFGVYPWADLVLSARHCRKFGFHLGGEDIAVLLSLRKGAPAQDV